MYEWKEIENALKKKGFDSREGDHTYLIFFYKGEATNIRTKLSHGSQQPGKDILSSIKRQLKFDSQKDFEKLIDYPMKQEEYESYLKNAKYI